jgi:AraC family transcriptional regulator
LGPSHLHPRSAPHAGEESRHLPSPERAAFQICAGVIAGPLPAAAEVPGRETLLTTRWPHREMHEIVPALPVHTIGTYYGPPAPRIWRCGSLRLAGTGRPGGIAIVPAHWSGHWDIDQGSALSYVLLSDSRLQLLAAPLARGRRVELVPRVAEADPVGAHILRALARLAAHPDRARALFVEQALDLLCTHLVRTHSSLDAVAISPPRSGLAAWQLRRVTNYMSERLAECIGLDELAELTALSRSHFCTAFRQTTGRTPHEWLTMLRLKHAQQLLRDPDIRIIDVGLSVGYQTPSAFAATFRRHIGMTPSAYRRQI